MLIKTSYYAYSFPGQLHGSSVCNIDFEGNVRGLYLAYFENSKVSGFND